MNKKKLFEYIEMIFSESTDYCFKRNLSFGAIDFAWFAQAITCNERLELVDRLNISCCKDFIKTLFDKHENGEVEISFFWKKAEEYGLCAHGTYGSSFSGIMNKALSEMVKFDSVFDENGYFLYNVYRLKFEK